MTQHAVEAFERKLSAKRAGPTYIVNTRLRFLSDPSERHRS